MSYKNNEGYPAPTEGEAIRRASRMPTHVYNDYCLLVFYIRTNAYKVYY